MMGQDVAASAPYTRRAPSPPLIPVPVFIQPNTNRLGGGGITMVPSDDNLDISQLTPQDLRIITRGERYEATSCGDAWKYEQRRQAQKILNYIYLGPVSAIRDQGFLQREGITMIMVIRDSRMSNLNLQSLDKAVQTLDIVDKYVGLDSAQHLIHRFPETIRAINDHILAVYHSQTGGMDMGGDQQSNAINRGKVLLACETGNDRSATIAAAYIMTMYGTSLSQTLQFINMQRFCCIFDEDTKRLLLAWEDILRARTAVSHAQAQVTPSGNSKRRIEDTIDAENMSALGDNLAALDFQRFDGRREFQPFIDVQQSAPVAQNPLVAQMQ